MIVLIVVAAGIAFLLLIGWLVDRHDRREGHSAKNAKQLGEDIRAARRAQRASLVTRAWVRRPRPDRTQPFSGYRPPDGTRRPVKRGQ